MKHRVNSQNAAKCFSSSLLHYIIIIMTILAHCTHYKRHVIVVYCSLFALCYMCFHWPNGLLDPVHSYQTFSPVK